MRMVSNLLLVMCTGLTGLLFVLAADMHRLSGPDRVGAEIQFLLVAVPRWLMMSVVLSGLVARGAFEWVQSARQV